MSNAIWFTIMLLLYGVFMLLCLTLSLFLILRHQTVWTRYMGVIKSCIIRMYHE